MRVSGNSQLRPALPMANPSEPSNMQAMRLPLLIIGIVIVAFCILIVGLAALAPRLPVIAVNDHTFTYTVHVGIKWPLVLLIAAGIFLVGLGLKGRRT